MPDAPARAKVARYLDEDIPPKVAEALRQRGCDVVSAYEVGNVSYPDEQHLVFGAD